MPAAHIVQPKVPKPPRRSAGAANRYIPSLYLVFIRWIGYNYNSKHMGFNLLFFMSVTGPTESSLWTSAPVFAMAKVKSHILAALRPSPPSVPHYSLRCFLSRVHSSEFHHWDLQTYEYRTCTHCRSSSHPRLVSMWQNQSNSPL
jgi:hypothetical protein